jgi:hypothetical protein
MIRGGFLSGNAASRSRRAKARAFGVAHNDHVAYGFAALPPLAAGRSSDPFQMCIAGEALPPSISD